MDPFVGALLLNDDKFITGMAQKLSLSKADTISIPTNLLWYDLTPQIQFLYAYRELIPRISRLPRLPGNGGNAHHWKRIVAIDPNNTAGGVSEGNRGARIGILEQDMVAVYKTLGYESSVTYEGRLGARNLTPEALGIAVVSQLRRTMIWEEQCLIFGNASVGLGLTPTPSLSAGTAPAGITSTIPTGTLYVRCVALAGFGALNTTTYNSVTNTGGVPGQVTKINADGTSDTFGGGSAQPSVEASVATSSGQVVTATLPNAVNGACGYAWYVSTATGTERLWGVTVGPRAIFASVPGSTAQPIQNLFVGGNAVDNSVNQLVPDGVLPMVYNAILGPAPGTAMATQATLPSVVTPGTWPAGDTLTIGASGALIYQMNPSNTGLTISGSNIGEIDTLLQAAYTQYKVGFDRILVSAPDAQNVWGRVLSQAATNSPYRIFFDADPVTGRITMGRRINAYFNKWFGNTLEVEVHPFMPPGTMLFWSDRSPYEVSNVPQILSAKTRQDYYQISWPPRTRRYEFGVYVDEVFELMFSPAFAVITGINSPSGPTIQ